MDHRLISLLKVNKEGLTFQKIASDLRVPKKQRNKILEQLKKLEKDGIVRRVKGRFRLSAGSNVLRGTFVTTQKGFGFVTPAEGGEDIFIPARYALGALQGDVVEVQANERGRRGKPEGRIIRIVRKTRKKIFGIYKERSGSPFLLAFDSPSPEEIPLSSKGKLRPAEGTIVEADRATLEVTGILGLPDDEGVDLRIVILRHNLRSEFPADARAEAEAIVSEIPEDEIASRKDFRNWLTFTIDGENAQDFDDAVSMRRLENGNFLLGVHIADVSHYVRPGSLVEAEAFERGTSVYFPGVTLHMLPENLSTDLCSLRPRVPRLAFSVLLEINPRGGVAGSDFQTSVIQTAERMTYTSVQKIFDGDEAERERYQLLLDSLNDMRELAAALRQKRLEEGSLDFDLVEPELVYQEGRLEAITSIERNEAHRLIEEFMVAANVAVASFLHHKNIPLLYRVHPPPAVADLEKLRTILSHFGVMLPAADRLKSKNIQQVLEKVKGAPEEKFINVQVLRSMKLAVYSDENQGHYGLAKKDYAHFTSPIRRYPDLAVHRILKDALRPRRAERAEESPLAAWGIHCSERERAADEAERDLVEWRILRFLKTRLGEEFSGMIVDINRAGLVVELDDYFVDGILPFQALGGDYYYRRNEKTLRGKRRGRTFDLGDRIRVVLVSCDPILRRMSFVLCSSPEEDS